MLRFQSEADLPDTIKRLMKGREVVKPQQLPEKASRKQPKAPGSRAKPAKLPKPLTGPERDLDRQLSLLRIPYQSQARFLDGRKFVADFLFHDAKLIVEVDGGGWGQGRHHRAIGYRQDCERDALAMLDGWRVLRVVPEQVTSGQAIRWIRALIERRG